VRDGSGLPGRSGGSGRSRSTDITCSAASDETAADLCGDVKLATRKGARPGDGIARTAITRRFRLEQPDHSFGAVRRPCRDDPTFGFAQGLPRNHTRIFPGADDRPSRAVIERDVSSARSC
jgi:hypothetical protein